MFVKTKFFYFKIIKLVFIAKAEQTQSLGNGEGSAIGVCVWAAWERKGRAIKVTMLLIFLDPPLKWTKYNARPEYFNFTNSIPQNKQTR